MSIGKRLIDLARSELNSLLERAGKGDDDGDAGDGNDDTGEGQADPGRPATARKAPAPSTGGGYRSSRPVRLEDLSDEELEAEIERRRLDREMEDRARRTANARPAAGSYRAPGGSAGASRTGSGSARAGGSGAARGAVRPSTPVDPVAKAYAALEVPPGSNFETVRKAYRNMMRKYHPDRHAGSPEKQKAANELAQKLTESYKILEKRLRK